MKSKIIFTIILTSCLNIGLWGQQTNDSTITNQTKPPKIGLVLSGGGAKGLAHIGVLKVLEECGIKPDYITGTSMGSIVGGLYALGYKAAEIEQIVLSVDWSILLTDQITWREIGIFHKDEYPEYPIKFIFNKHQKPSLPSGMIEGQKIHELLSKLCWTSNKYRTFDDFPIPYRCVATDIMTGQPIVFKEGNLADAMRTSMSIPTVFSPVIIDSLLLADGGMVRNYPVQECLDMGAEFIIGSYTGFDEKAKATDIRSMVSILARSSVFQGINDARLQIPKTNILIVPDLKDYGPENFSKAEQIMLQGEEAARDSLMYQRLTELGMISKNPDRQTIKDELGNVTVNQIIISGSPTADIRLIEELCNIYPDSNVNQDILNKAVNRLYATGDYKKVSYQIVNRSGKNILVFKCTENEAGKIELGIQYDNTYGAAALVRFSMRDFIIHSSLFKVKIAISENPRLQINYDFFLNKRKNLAVFANSYLQTNKMPNVLRNSDTVMVTGHYRYNHLNYSLGAKMQLWKNGEIEVSAGQNINALKLKDGMQYIFKLDQLNYFDNYTMLRFDINNLDDPYFPTRGIFMNMSYKWVFGARMSKNIETLYVDDLSTYNEIARFNYKQYIRIKKRLSLISELQVGFMMKKSFLSEEFFIGGSNYQLHPNAVNMGGINANNIVADNFVKLGFGLQFKFFDKWYLQYGQEMLGFVDYKQVYTENEEVVGEAFSAWYVGLGVSTRIGPMRLICSGSDDHKGLFWSLNLGIPF